ncbi:MAG: 4-hydroxythreonine-4-phosphate dehydrogenase PdxA [Pseudomonadota bacterium]
MRRPTLAITPGEPAGIGPEIALAAASRFAEGSGAARLVLVADRGLLAGRATELAMNLEFVDYLADRAPPAGAVEVLHVPLAVTSRPGHLDPRNARYVLATLDAAIDVCQRGQADALVTAPVHKAVINDAGVAFTGHTEYLAERSCGHPVMMLAAPELRVALVTTHLPLSAVPAAIRQPLVEKVTRIVDHDLRQRFGIEQPRLQLCGLNPHAGEGGHLGLEDDAEIVPAVAALKRTGLRVEGPWPGDTAFVPSRRKRFDATIAMYHDQGLAVLKALGFGDAVNVTLGLDLIRTSVDHGTALDIAGRGEAECESLLAAIDMAAALARTSLGNRA